ncbi:hypothetical protein OsI_25625 [Oryza sativa Indica Group]|uniref:FBD domain-containing protein n=1 Tax=Oryza sativa subsp. indica TaxID=39946 RepID=A2YK77_ORYSI|nr:hypothetical protein OsI_25625 [Oryza sativa Indica Group]
MDATDPPPPPPPLTRKRGREARKSKEAAPPREPRRARSRSHVPPPPGAGDGRGGDGEEDVGFDLINRLPDAVLGDIISRLPTKDGGKTRALSKRWRPVWRTAPLNLDAGDLAPNANGAALAVLVTQILLVHAGPVRRFCIPAQQIHERPAMVECWLGSRRFKNLEELEFTVPEDPFYGRSFLLLPPPPSTFRFSATLRVAAISQCSLPDCTATLALRFPQLRLLSLQEVIVSEHSLHSIIAGCPALEGLLLKRSFGFRCLRINSPTIRSVAFHSPCCGDHCVWKVGFHLEEVVIEDAPCLERLIHIERAMGLGVNVTVIAAPELEACVLDDLDDGYYRLDFGKVVFKGFAVINYTTPVSSIKILALIRDNLRLDRVIELMRCFQCLEKLYITASHYGATNCWRRKHWRKLKSLDICLKTLVLDNYRGLKSQINFATFFIRNATKLENMIFTGGRSNGNAYFIARQQKLLEFEKRASKTAHFHFTTKKCYYDWVHIKDVHDLSIADPFECTC